MARSPQAVRFKDYSRDSRNKIERIICLAAAESFFSSGITLLTLLFCSFTSCSSLNILRGFLSPYMDMVNGHLAVAQNRKIRKSIRRCDFFLSLDSRPHGLIVFPSSNISRLARQDGRNPTFSSPLPSSLSTPPGWPRSPVHFSYVEGRCSVC